MNNFEFSQKMKVRTKAFAVQIVKFYKTLPKTDEARVLGRQVLRSGTSVAANYRAVCRSKSQADFVSKMGTVVEEADETLLWLELLEEAEICPAEKLARLKAEANELLRIFSTGLGTAKTRTSLTRQLIHS
ncbi:MAG TPA: four helix bundle protein [Verrucomicrobiae bacterium]|nr:four helix bundle protein [Verrucomicrobiae bacterium]